MRPSAHPAATRRGTILIVIAGISALLASLCLAFLMRVRQAAEGSQQVANETQARIMLHAACAYLLESGRLGYGLTRDDSAAGRAGSGVVTGAGGRRMHREGHGWIDIRSLEGDGFPDPALPGPRDQNGETVYRAGAGFWPEVGTTVICPMHRWTRPPYAIRPTIAANPILVDPARRGDAAWGRPLLREPDPQPASDNGWPGAVDGRGWGEFALGDPAPVAASNGLAWFRLHRVSAATFVVTCGAGGTMGFRDWNEVRDWQRVAGAPGGPELFGNDPGLFASLLLTEVRLWYEVRWSGAVKPLDFRYEEALWWRWLQNAFAYRIYPVNGTQYPGWSRTNRYNPNPVGTISYLQRLDAADGSPLDTTTRQPLPAW
jgi:hypothetical protein